jgi:IS1 family transposase
MYKQSNANTMLFFSGQAIDKPADRENYWLWHAYSNKLKRYYQYLLTACSNKYNFWLNDLLPKEPARKKRRTLKSATHQEAKYITEIK